MNPFEALEVGVGAQAGLPQIWELYMALVILLIF